MTTMDVPELRRLRSSLFSFFIIIIREIIRVVVLSQFVRMILEGKKEKKRVRKFQY